MNTKYKGLWTPKYMAERLLFPKPASVSSAEGMLNAWASDIVEENYPKWINPNKEKPNVDRKIIFKLKNNDKRMGVFLPKDQFDRENMFCDGSFHKLETIIGWMYVPD